ncbi:tyrosine-type recombinase/integrase [Kiloniella antarctica]|uniref:Tyrosine-type recombinase/integrase n=1 Tax=Kiloniella antarctica TaxID=1550907 RepID=A0ABW5BLZ0_9PROT
MKINLKHIHRVKKKTSKGHKYYYYHRFTRARLPNDPNSVEFMVALEEQSRFGRPKEGTLGQLIEEYKASPEFTQRSKNTKSNYVTQMEKLKPLTDLPIRGLTRAHCKKIQTKYSDKPSTANLIVSVISNLMRFAIDMEYRTDNPARGIKKLETGEYRPWTDDEFKRFLVGASKTLSMSAALGLFTGQRVSDCLKMKWDDFADGLIFVKQQKTGIELHIPCHPILLKKLSSVPIEERGVYIVDRTKDKPYSRSHFTNLFIAHRSKIGLPKDLHFHGLRKSSAVALADAGCTERQIMSITGHSSVEMVSHYVKKLDQKRQAKQAMNKLAKGNKL